MSLFYYFVVLIIQCYVNNFKDATVLHLFFEKKIHLLSKLLPFHYPSIAVHDRAMFREHFEI